jgi:hypothetical protein
LCSLLARAARLLSRRYAAAAHPGCLAGACCC